MDAHYKDKIMAQKNYLQNKKSVLKRMIKQIDENQSEFKEIPEIENIISFDSKVKMAFKDKDKPFRKYDEETTAWFYKKMSKCVSRYFKRKIDVEEDERE